jgi:phosphonoacetaldehyde hydrolase
VLGFSKEHYDELSNGEIWNAKRVAEQKFFDAGADFVIDSISDLPELIKQIDEKLR